VQVIVHNSEPRTLDGEHPDQVLEPVLDPLLAVFISLSAQKRAADASGNAMIPGRDRLIDDGGAWRGHECCLHVGGEQENSLSLILEPGVVENLHREAQAGIPRPSIYPGQRCLAKGKDLPQGLIVPPQEVRRARIIGLDGTEFTFPCFFLGDPDAPPSGSQAATTPRKLLGLSGVVDKMRIVFDGAPTP
jgi:hypothetical protein